MGPIHYVVIAFDHPDFHRQLAAELAKLVDQEIVRLLDLVFVGRAADGTVSALEVDSLPDGGAAYANVNGEYGGLVNEEDLADVAQSLEPGTSGALLIWENTWADRFVAAIVATGGLVIDEGVIPAETAAPALNELREGA